MWYYIPEANAHQTRCARSLKNGHNGGNAYEKNDSFCDGAGIGLYITVKLTSGTACVGGVSYAGTKLKNCYNTGAVSLTGNGLVGGIAAEFYSGYSNYNTGKISGKGKTLYKGEIAGNAGYSYLDGVTVYDNYYTGSGKKSGSESTSWKPYQSKAKKVSSITFGNCSKLSSKYWTYSNKHKRLILKNNKEA